MQATALIISRDAGFAETIQALLHGWGMTVFLSEGAPGQHNRKAEIVLFDIRDADNAGLAPLPVIRETMPSAEIILINRPDNIPLSIAGMQAGAADELIAPFDTGSLKNIISQAIRRMKKRRGKKSLFRRFGDAMAAATFAQAGEFDMAVSLLDGQEENPSPDSGTTSRAGTPGAAPDQG